MANVELNIHVQIKELQKGLKKVQQGQKELANQSTKTQKTMQNNIKGTTKSVQGLGAAFVAVFSIAAVTRLTKSVIAVRGEFATFQAVLTNTLGSAQAAQREFDKIQKFAAETPFSVRGLTEAFVRLVNQGFKPTTAQLRKLGDLASSTGKDFIQLTEAILDAQTGEFERLKEFGIKSKKEGDKVTFTFKEQATQVAYTSKAIQEYILSLGDMEGVSGAMAAISETLNGRISNLADSWEGLLNVLGGRTEGVFFKVIDLVKNLVDGIKSFNELAEPETAGRRRANVITSMMGDDFDASELEVINRYIRNFTLEMFNVQHQIATLQEQEKEATLAGIFYLDKDKTKNLIEQREELIALIDTLRGFTVVTEENNEVKEEENKRDKNYIKNLIQRAKLEKHLKDQFKVEGEKEIDPVKAVEEDNKKQLKILDETIDQESDLYEKRADKEIEEHERALAAIKAIEQQKRLLQQGTFEAILSGLDLLAAAGKENALLQQLVAVSQAIINGALGITKTGAQLGYPAAIPFQIALGLQTLAQIATIKQQKFERGGYDVLKGRRHAQGGVDIGIGEAEAGEGLAVFNRTATQKYGKFLPAFVKAINENNGDLGYSDGAYMISFDDSKSVNELKQINKHLNKPDIRYEKGYRIETRKGQTTRVKI